MSQTYEKRKPLKTSFAIPFTQFDWGDYYADTDFLTFAEHGMYWNLLRRYYTTGPFIQDLADLKRKMRYSDGGDTEVLAILNEYFYLSEEDDCWHHKRCDEEILRAKGISEIQSQRARKAAQSRSRDCSGKFVIETDRTPAAAGLPPAIEEEELRVIKRPISIEEEEQELRKTLRIKYKQEYQDVINEDDRERYITQEVERDIRQWGIDKARERFGMKKA